MSKPSSASEKAFEELIESHLLEYGSYEHCSSEYWSRELALDRGMLFRFIRETQPKEWERLAAIHGQDIELRLLQRLVKELDNRGMLDVLRNGIIDYGVRFHLAYFKPASGLNPETQRLYKANRLTVIRQLHFSLRDQHDAVDLVLCLNGLPVATVELKNRFTGQEAEDARRQYIEDRDTRELLFSFKKRALVHFAVDPDEVWMTTYLKGRDTRFLPFNKGYNGGAGNPPNPNGHRSSYLWEQIWIKDTWMDILGHFMHLQLEELSLGDRKIKKESLIFPRYHQLDVVRLLKDAVREEGVGRNYLIQHSAGSGKSNSIAWLAHGLSSLHTMQNEPIFGSVVVISDRRVLDRQLQDTIYQFEHKHGVVARIDKDSNQLAQALEMGAKIIITTLQKFPFVLDKIDNLPERKYAVIVDEAHSSQTGEAADALKMALSAKNTTNNHDQEDDTQSGDNEWDYEDQIVKFMESRKAKQPNMSFFAFTATPKPRTLEAFGIPGSDGKPRAWHLYSMRQAIEEGFILDVLKNYTTYKVFFKLSKAIDEDPRLDVKQATRAIAKFIRLHPYNLAQKVEVIIEHFRRVVMNKIGGQAKAMVVTSSRLEAVRYKQEIDRYLKEREYSDIKALVAFSGVVKDDFDIEYSEANMNGFGEQELPDRFAGEEYRMLVVADKYLTGFDQPLLHTMYVDKKLSGVHAVQTLSRLNRTYPGKDDTFVLDFANEAHEIQAAFQPFYEGTTIEEDIDPNQLYDIKAKLDSFMVTHPAEIEGFASIFFQPRNIQNARDHARLNSFLDPAVERLDEKSLEERNNYKHLLAAFIHLYSFLSQIMPFTDAELEKFYAYGRMLATKVRDDTRTALFQIQDEVALEYYRLQKMSEGTISLERSGESTLRVPADIGTGSGSSEKARLSTVIEALNERFGTEFTPSDQLFFDQIEEDLVKHPDLAKQAKNNSADNFKYPFNDVFIGTVIERMEQNQEISDKIINEDRFAEAVRELLLQKVYRRLQEA